MSLKTKKQHYLLALHNEQACDYLNNSKHYFDWVITTAFYAALHHVNAVIFPVVCNIKGKVTTVNDIEKYRALLGSNKNKHRLMSELVFRKCPGIGNSYNTLLELSHAARYDPNFQSWLYAERARHYMSGIKAHCCNDNQPHTSQVSGSEDQPFQTRY